MTEPDDPTSQGEPAAAAVEGAPARHPTSWRVPALLFLATVLSVFMSGAAQQLGETGQEPSWSGVLRTVVRGWPFAVPLLGILCTHELGHYLAARWHRVPASLPYFIPLPLWEWSLFGTMGAVISMRERIRSRNALLDIGAAGPLAGLVVAIPVLVVGLAQSEVKPLTGHGLMEGQCLLYLLLKWLVLGPIPPGHDVFLSPTAFAGWAGLLLTVLNLLPIGQLDGGHVAYALLGERQHRLALVLHWSLLLVFAYNVAALDEVGPGMIWLVWFLVLYVLRRLSGGNHPPTEPGELSPRRRVIAVLCLLLFVALFMPTPMRAY
jgi:membrane-associated protease RseP (regulator of RpoE activity)